MGMKLHTGDSILNHLEKIRILDFTIKQKESLILQGYGSLIQWMIGLLGMPQRMVLKHLLPFTMLQKKKG